MKIPIKVKLPLYTSQNLTWRNENIDRTLVVVVGCGGTGGRIIPLIAQHIANHNKEIATNPRHNQYVKHPMKLLLVDMDIVEQKNLKRQNFFAFDVNKNKAECMALRYGALYGIDIDYSSEKFSDELFAQRYNYNIIIFDCTDNLTARKSIESSFTYNNIYYCISCGNEDTFGQVIVSCVRNKINTVNRTKDLLSDFITICQAEDVDEDKFNLLNNEERKKFLSNKKVVVNTLPTLLELYKDFKDTEKPSCTDMVLADEQSMPINSLVAQLAYNEFYTIVSGGIFNHNMVTCSIDNIFYTNMIKDSESIKRLLFKSIFGEYKKSREEIVLDFCYFTSSFKYEILEIARKKNNIALFTDEYLIRLATENIDWIKPLISYYLSAHYNIKAETKEALTALLVQ